MDKVHAVDGEREWYQTSTDPGCKGERWYDWQCRVLAADGDHYLLFRRSYTDADDWQANVTFALQEQGCNLTSGMDECNDVWTVPVAPFSS